MPTGRISDLGNITLTTYVEDIWKGFPDIHKRAFKVGFGLLVTISLLGPIAVFLLYLVSYTGSLTPVLSFCIGFELGAVLLMAFGMSGFGLLFYTNDHPVIAATHLLLMILIFGGFHWATFQVLSLDLLPVLLGYLLPPLLGGISEFYR